VGLSEVTLCSAGCRLKLAMLCCINRTTFPSKRMFCFDSSDRHFAPISLHTCFLYQNIELVAKIMKHEFAVLN